MALAALVACGGAPRSAPSKPALALATAPLPVPAAELASWVDAYAAGFGREWGPANAPNGYLVVAKDGVPILSRAYGKASPRTNAPAIGPSTRFQIGSVTKQLTAVAVLQLAEKKRLNLTDSVRLYVPGLPAEWDAITLHHLLSHTSGIASYTADPELMAIKKQRIPRERIVATFAGKPLELRPGENFAYSNSNYFLLGLVIEKATGKTYEEALQASVLVPAGMARSTTSYEPFAFDTAAGTTVDENEQVRAVEPWDTPLPFAAGALRSSALDMIAWDRALAAGRLLRADSERLRTTPVKDDYGYGVVVQVESGHPVESHSGGIDGFGSFFARVPDLGVAVVFLCNSDAFDASAFGHAVTNMIVSAKAVPPKVERAIGRRVIDAILVETIAGEYDLLPTSREKLSPKVPSAVLDGVAKMSVTSEKSRVRVKANGQPAFLAFPAIDKRALFTKKSRIEIFPVVDAGGQVTGLRIEQEGLVLEYARVTRGT